MKAKKSLGQNFLKSEVALRKIVEAGEIKLDDIILEIGPGKGALTEQLLERAGTVIAVEKDRELFEFLKEKFAKQIALDSLVLVHEDIMRFEMNEAILIFMNGLAEPDSGRARRTEDLNKNTKLRNYKIIANIPYNITGAILKKFLTAENQPSAMVLMVQQEVAQRIIARDGKQSILSISVKAYGEPKMIMKVEKRYFSPAPKVDSAIIAIKNISRGLFEKNKIDEEEFWQIVKKGFAHKRKKLSSNLKNIILPSQEPFLRKLGDKRAENLTLEDWISLAK
ncbi:MAG: Ribosomal RNA small subunit methyltransferase A [Candidatus Nomurabacteria bacterium GW2011_GWF2_43_8]|uniref:Ribosomal RNA small subunit methyltransferase A n=3 Tax=Candidatus Nomuraibacteriota TaxID=1752729 RepID=A0A0G1FR84_9BACT|nr:MAG: Ribosomal RNA small subunit methyltransferase A [Candidatus Nomurabacteria bacterium GW2011_GWA2_43_15]KKT19404.1 MAG: Ribosomal RNA small subunit methyltransferase A [Candidatus Nomurabacteria bacterium GW2011_GWB1_43_7]KKT24885.1 MAG: Ribosomal RNA small subunit methyltransferase A [Candidatus Nomurabacteria bacterium GW2011_GWF2_43_8]